MPRSINENHNLVTSINPKSPISEAYRTLRTNILFSSIDEQIRTIMVASAQAGEGKTITVSNLAVAYAQEGKKVLLIDVDFRKPSLHKVFTVSNQTGLTSVLSNQCELQDVVRETFVEHLDVITSGPIPPNPSEMLSSRKMKTVLEETKDLYDVILFDTPPVLAVTDALIVSSFCDGVILVVNSSKVKKEVVKKAKANLEHVNARFLGVVLNNINVGKDNPYYYYYGEK
ncbi:CpsD/CapB family tyrosine-protein kinase [Paenibacillus sp. IHBB 10380]|uniref:CpsD/CapB family tyrosine-protein kinase n=1 Tax=Paenibacillus sp. IHBB 10380 TaxID=1566358 RepID=UPI0005CFE334|nr:CpsD/CapB family tyrosine-protein kinase [Paenibacillus sp. IHBB 10380]AJS60045.1 capsular biosynthesis protein [Paenibacillus sp. IHBB 10380]